MPVVAKLTPSPESVAKYITVNLLKTLELIKIKKKTIVFVKLILLI